MKTPLDLTNESALVDILTENATITMTAFLTRVKDAGHVIGHVTYFFEDGEIYATFEENDEYDAMLVIRTSLVALAMPFMSYGLNVAADKVNELIAIVWG